MSAISITPANVLKGASSQLLQATAGPGITITAGQAIYVDPATNLAILSDSNGSPPLNACSGVALNGASPGQPVNYVSADALLTLGAATLTAGDTLWVGNTVGTITATYADIASGSTVISLGVAVTTAAFNLNITVGGTK